MIYFFGSDLEKLNGKFSESEYNTSPNIFNIAGKVASKVFVTSD